MARLGSAVATRIPALANRAPYNKARGFTLSDQLVLADIVGFYDDVGIRPAIEVSEPHASDQLGGLLSNAGLAPIARGITLHVAPRNVPPLEVAGLEIREVTQENRDVYIALLLEAYELPTHAPALRQMFAREHAAPGLRRYLAVVDGTPAAAAALDTRAGTGLLAGAATLPAFRRRGCQSALIAQRLADATPTVTSSSPRPQRIPPAMRTWFRTVSTRHTVGPSGDETTSPCDRPALAEARDRIDA